VSTRELKNFLKLSQAAGTQAFSCDCRVEKLTLTPQLSHNAKASSAHRPARRIRGPSSSSVMALNISAQRRTKARLNGFTP
jgi:hypothetical protein